MNFLKTLRNYLKVKDDVTGQFKGPNFYSVIAVATQGKVAVSN